VATEETERQHAGLHSSRTDRWIDTSFMAQHGLVFLISANTDCPGKEAVTHVSVRPGSK